MAKVIFRKIGGRIVPIGISGSVKPMPGAKDLREVSIKATNGFSRVGEVWGQQSLKRKHRFYVGSHINPEYRGAGVGKEMYQKLGAVIRSLGGKTMVGSTDNAKVIQKVRQSVGKTRMKQDIHSDSAKTFVTLLKKKVKRG